MRRPVNIAVGFLIGAAWTAAAGCAPPPHRVAASPKALPACEMPAGYSVAAGSVGKMDPLFRDVRKAKAIARAASYPDENPRPFYYPRETVQDAKACLDKLLLEVALQHGMSIAGLKDRSSWLYLPE